MLLALLISALCCLLLWLYLRWISIRQFWAKRGVPYAPPNPLLGSLTFLFKKNPGTWMMEMYQKYNSPYIGVWLFWRPALIINSPAIAKNIMVKDFACFKDRFLSSGSTDPIGAYNLFTTNDPLWSTMRRKLTSTFTASKLRALQPLFDTKSSELVQRVKNTADKTKISLRHLFTDYTTDVFATAAFGVKTNATLTQQDPMRSVTNSFMEFDVYRGLNWISIFFFPELVDTFRFKFFPKSATDYFTKVFNFVVEQRMNNRNANDCKDLLDVLIKIKEDSAANNEGISDDIIVSQAAIFLLGGFETSGSALSFAFYELAHNQDIQEKLYQELVGVKTKSDIDMATLADLPYLNAVIDETLRKYPPMGWLDRIASVDYKVDDKLTIPAGTPVYINSIGMHYDSNYFPEPEIFNPDRFLPENNETKPFTYLPFGDGPRGCIGKRFGQISVRHAIASLLLNYKIEPIPGCPKPSEVQIERNGLFLVPGQILNVKFIDRN